MFLSLSESPIVRSLDGGTLAPARMALASILPLGKVPGLRLLIMYTLFTS
jgi:hypothetical protein